VRDGTPPPSAPKIDAAADGSTPVRDEHGIATGGIRTPWMDVPINVLSGMGQHGSEFAFLFGVTAPLERSTLSRLYPGGHDDYLAKFEAALAATVRAGFLLEADATEIAAVAAAASPFERSETSSR
jgi:hypothetical protein